MSRSTRVIAAVLAVASLSLLASACGEDRLAKFCKNHPNSPRCQ
jgi:hypothetical protein